MELTERPITADVVGDNRTIVAIATAAGRGALALIRVSGPETQAVAARLLTPAPTIPRRATRCRARNADDVMIDDVMATLLLAPNSFTGEDMLEVGTHGGLIVPAAVLAAAIHAGAREATPGEFTRRAVLNGKLDLLQAEAIGDLIDARSSAAHHLALRQLDGGLSERIRALREGILGLEALLAYDIDFPEEDDGPVSRSRIEATAEELIRVLEILLATRDQGTLVHEGALVVLAGATNVGKSSLFNALLGEARAIVTELPGTTRDAIEAVLDLPCWPLRLVDTAGLRATTDVIEQLGIDTLSRYLGRASLVLACVDSPEALGALDEIRHRTSAPILIVATKADLVTQDHESSADAVVSARTGEGLAGLLELIEERVSRERGVVSVDTPVLTRARHSVAVSHARRELTEFVVAWRDDLLPASVAATHVRAAADVLSELIGVVYVNDVLDVVFRQFCIGK